MFYAHFVLSKKGPLAKIWLAAHWDKKLTKAHVFETNIDSSVEAIIEPKVKMALRTSGHLLLGVVRIYSRKAKYLLADCNEAFVKIKMAFRPGVVDLPEENREAAVATITLPETFHDFDTTMADLSDIDVQAQFSVNQSRPEEITMREDLGNITLVGDDGFGDMGFDDRNMIQDAQLDDSLYKNTSGSNMDLDEVEKSAEDNQEKPMDIDFEAQARNDGFGETLDDFDPPGVHDDDSDDNDNFGDDVDTELFGDANFMGDTGGLFEEPQVPPVPPVADPTAPPEGPEPPQLNAHAVSQIQAPEDTTQPPQEQTTMSTVPDQTTLVPNEAEAFALEPLDVTSLGTERKSKRKRKLIVDEQKGIASETMKMQLSDTSEIVTTLDLAPPTKKLMHWKETGGVEKLFALPGRPIPSKGVGKMFQRNLVTRSILEEDQEDDDRLELEQPRDEEESKHQDIEPRHSTIPEQPSVAEDPSHIEPPLDASRQSTNIFDASVTRQSNVFDSSNASVQQPSVFDAPNIPQGRPEPGFQIQDEPEMPPVPPPMDHSDDEDDFAPLGAPSPPSDDGLPEPEEPEPEDDQDDLFGTDLPEVAPEEEQGDEPQTAEEAEEQEERRWNKRTQQLLHYINKAMDNSPRDVASFHSMLHRNNRKQVASKFYTLLVLKKQQSIDVMQEEPYGDILITKGPRYEVVA